MKIFLRFYPVLMLIVIGLYSCQLEELQDPIVIPKDIEPEFYVDLQEYLHPTNRQLLFKIRTIDEQECENAGIETDYYVLGRDIDLSINNILPPADCKAGPAPAKSEVFATVLAPGTYNFDVALSKTVVNKGQLRVNEDNFTIKMETQEGIIFLHNNLQKMPNDAFWGYVVCDESEWENLNASLIETLDGLASAANYRSGYYGHFEINNNTTGSRKVFLTDPPKAVFHFPLLFRLTEDVDESRLKALLEDFRNKHPNITLEGRNTDGRIF